MKIMIFMSLYFVVLTAWFFLAKEEPQLGGAEFENFKLEAVSRGFATFKFDGKRVVMIWEEGE